MRSEGDLLGNLGMKWGRRKLYIRRVRVTGEGVTNYRSAAMEYFGAKEPGSDVIGREDEREERK